MPSVVHELSENNFFGVHCDFFKIIKHISRYNVNLGDTLTYSAFYYVNLLLGSSLQVTLVSKTSLLPVLTRLLGLSSGAVTYALALGFHKMFCGFSK